MPKKISWFTLSSHNSDSPGLLETAESPFLQLQGTVFVDGGETGTVGGSVKDVLSCPHSYTTLTAPQPSHSPPPLSHC